LKTKFCAFVNIGYFFQNITFVQESIRKYSKQFGVVSRVPEKVVCIHSLLLYPLTVHEPRILYVLGEAII
jgi:hypothetical protein